MTWEQRFSTLAALDGDEWDAEHERLEREWLAAYTAAFVRFAVSRGWRQANAETWPRRGVHRSLPLRLGPAASR
jgi:hypothetical protein